MADQTRLRDTDGDDDEEFDIQVEERDLLDSEWELNWFMKAGRL